MCSRNLFFVFTYCIIALGLFSCDGSKVFDSMQDLDSNAWNENREMVYKVTIPDASESYKLFYTIRYDNNYPYYNLYINRVMEDSSGKFLNKKLQGMDLFKPVTGVPFGSGMGAKKDYLILSEDNYKFPYAGNYTFKLKQYMRQENVQGISAVGFRIEKAAGKN
jgi:gliding motility-associated lipoprotein GldH